MKQSIKIVSVNISEKKGTVKKPVDEILLNEKGVQSDAHSGDWHRQVSLLGVESFGRFHLDSGRKADFGEFAENITTEGMEIFLTKPGDLFKNKDIELEVTQIGKKCQGTGCAIYNEVGKCVMPKEGIFCKVIKGGKLVAGDILNYYPNEHGI